jgi:hypothetical protein
MRPDVAIAVEEVVVLFRRPRLTRPGRASGRGFFRFGGSLHRSGGGFLRDLVLERLQQRLGFFLGQQSPDHSGGYIMLALEVEPLGELLVDPVDLQAGLQSRADERGGLKDQNAGDAFFAGTQARTAA